MHPPAAVTVRAAGHDDLPDAVRLYQQLHLELDLRVDEPAAAAWAATLATPGRTVLLAEAGGVVVGTADLTVLANAARAGRPYLLVENVVVDAGARRAGVGRALLAAARAHGEAAGCYEVQLSADDPAAFAFYEAAGLAAAHAPTSSTWATTGAPDPLDRSHRGAGASPMRGYRAPRAFDGERFLDSGALVLVEGPTIVGVEPGTAPAPEGCPVSDLPDGTLLPGLVDTHVHLCADAGPRALDQVPELDPAELDAVVTAAERASLRAGVTAVRDLGDHRWTVLGRAGRDGERPTVVAAGPPITSPGGHCWSMGGETSGVDALRRAVRERAERGAGVVKVMASGGVLTPGTDLTACQFTLEELRAVVDEAHRLGLPVTAHAHGLAAVERSVAAGVDGIEHCSCLTGSGIHLPAELAAALAAGHVQVCPTVGFLPGVDPPPHVQARMAAVGATVEQHLPHVAGLYRAGVTLLAGTDAGISPTKPHGGVAHAVADLTGPCGVPLADALTAATARAARACGLGGRTGRLAAGYDADLLGADGDVTTDVTALQRPRLVVARGREVPLR